MLMEIRSWQRLLPSIYSVMSLEMVLTESCCPTCMLVMENGKMLGS
ncbi:unnamed protein product [Linum tenue]|uniref:Uncharacterized protein n=1 Tax=Linum tenue TaxID=586396 RepID=A0AAV0IDK4_9ROSI|nr:unnamed protein product [Linum tenue]